ncbi:hypothetical protein BBP40_005250 [Aspergillus hancockii]|nr:hypothetical protein BBP40_005250 [Aspergillus hancockii]
MAGLQAAKKDLRRKIRGVLQRIPAESITNQSRVAASRLFSLTEYQNAKRIGVYLSMPSGELSTTAIVQDALMNGKEVFIPYIHDVEVPSTQQKTSIMDMLALESMEEFNSLTPDKWGIPSLAPTQVAKKTNSFGGIGVSPAASEPSTTKGESGLDLIVMPGMAFDPDFRRLGHGKGYYDHFLTRYSKEVESKTTTMPRMPLLVALSLKEQILPPTEQIPVANHDWLVDVLIVGDDRCFVRHH